MIYFENTTEAQTFFVPISITDTGAGVLTFTMTSTVDRTVVLDVEVEDMEMYDSYRTFTAELPEGVQPGEYEYILRDGDVILSTGVATVAGGGEEMIQTDTTIEYEQYIND